MSTRYSIAIFRYIQNLVIILSKTHFFYYYIGCCYCQNYVHFFYIAEDNYRVFS